MKNRERNLLIIITSVFMLVLLGVFIVRQEQGTAISMSQIERTADDVTSPIEDGKININTANAEQLQQLPRVGEVLSNRIVAYREEHGDFKNKEDIMNVSGIGNSLYNNIVDYITLGE